MPTRKPHEASSITTEKRWDRDHPAFESLVKQGYDVPELDGARARADSATCDADIENGIVVKDWATDGS